MKNKTIAITCDAPLTLRNGDGSEQNTSSKQTQDFIWFLQKPPLQVTNTSCTHWVVCNRFAFTKFDVIMVDDLASSEEVWLLKYRSLGPPTQMPQNSCFAYVNIYLLFYDRENIQLATRICAKTQQTSRVLSVSQTTNPSIHTCHPPTTVCY